MEDLDLIAALAEAGLLHDLQVAQLTAWRRDWEALAEADRDFEINENWLRIVRAGRRLGARAPQLQLMWLWQLANHEHDQGWWDAAGTVAGSMGFEPISAHEGPPTP